MTLLDTHVIVWLTHGDTRLGPIARRAIDRSLAAEELAVSSVSFWELQMLHRRQRIELHYAVDEWRRLLLSEGLVEIPLDGEIAIRAANLARMHNDPADRFLVATALGGHRLVTADRRLLEWPGAISRLDASR